MNQMLMRVIYVVREQAPPLGFGVFADLLKHCTYVAGPFRNEILASGWIARHIEKDDRSDLFLVTKLERVDFVGKTELVGVLERTEEAANPGSQESP